MAKTPRSNPNDGTSSGDGRRRTPRGGASRSSTGGGKQAGRGAASGAAGRGGAKKKTNSQSSGSRRASTGSGRSSQRGTSGAEGRRNQGAKGGKTRRRDLQGAAANLPNWVVEGLARVTPDRRVGPALLALGEASEAFAEGSYHRAVRKAQQAKDLAPRDPTVRETLGIAAYRTGDWQTALAELRTFRRLTGETTHLPVEMDSLRGLDRARDVESAWSTLKELGGKPAVLKEGAVVYASHLVDEGDLDGAWKVVAPRKLRHEPFPEDLRMWYVASRVAALRGDRDTAASLRDSILEIDPGFPGIDELEKLIAAL